MVDNKNTMFSEYGIVNDKFNLKDYNTYKLNCICDYFILIKDISKLAPLIKYIKMLNKKYFILGGGSNIILPEVYHGVVIKLDFKEIIYNGFVVSVSSSVYINQLASNIVKHNFSGLEWGAGIPGTIGGAIINNAGAYKNEIMDYVESIEVLENDEIKTIYKDNIDYSYRKTTLKDRNLVILKANIRLLPGDMSKSWELIKEYTEKRLNTQPIEYPSAGSVFRNPEGLSAGKLIDAAGLKGYSIGGAMISTKHANYIINTGIATSQNIKDLIKYTHDYILRSNNIDLELEQQIID